MKILLIGSGGREHALADCFYRNDHHIVCLPGNPGIDQIATRCPIQDPHDLEKIASYAQSEKIDLTVVGPEAPLEAGIVDQFTEKGLPIFGPKKQAAKLESSKVWSKEFMAKYAIPTASFHICDNSQKALELLPKCFEEWKGIVVKPDGLTAGKGVIPCFSLQEAKEAVRTIMEEEKYGTAGKRVILEKMLTGPEVSLLAFCDGNTIVPMIPSQDHKRLLEGDRGPNTGGVGAYAPLPFLDENEIQKIHEQVVNRTLSGLQQEKIDYTGVIYFGIMLTDEGPQLLEYNCRFGDPEAQVVLPLLESDLAKIMLSCTHKTLHNENIRWSNRSACCVVMTSGGYPEKFPTGYEITGLNEVDQVDNIRCFHAGTRKDHNGNIVTNGGRVLGVTALDDDLESAIKKAYSAVELIHFKGAYYRKDIARFANMAFDNN